jgi:hypothetical protein
MAREEDRQGSVMALRASTASTERGVGSKGAYLLTAIDISARAEQWCSAMLSMTATYLPLFPSSVVTTRNPGAAPAPVAQSIVSVAYGGAPLPEFTRPPPTAYSFASSSSIRTSDDGGCCVVILSQNEDGNRADHGARQARGIPYDSGTPSPRIPR